MGGCELHLSVYTRKMKNFKNDNIISLDGWMWTSRAFLLKRNIQVSGESFFLFVSRESSLFSPILPNYIKPEASMASLKLIYEVHASFKIYACGEIVYALIPITSKIIKWNSLWHFATNFCRHQQIWFKFSRVMLHFLFICNIIYIISLIELKCAPAIGFYLY